MARIFRNPYVLFNSLQLNVFLRDLTLSYEVDEKETTTLADSTHLSFPGLKKWRITAKLLQSFAASEIDATMFPLIGDEVAKAIEVRPTNAAVSATNPKYTGTGYLLKYPPMSGSVGDVHETDVEIGPASDLVRATS